MSIRDLYCSVDTFWQQVAPWWEREQLASGQRLRHRVFAVDARRGKTSVGWFYGFKLHLVVNYRASFAG